MRAFRGTPLSASIAAVIGAYGALEAIAFSVIAAAFGFPAFFLWLFLGVQAVFHIGLAIFLLAESAFFYIVDTGERLSRVNAANKVTLLRISMLPTILFLILAARDFPVGPILIFALSVTFLTDMIDGRISRTKKQVTHMGKILDSVSDYALLIVVAVAYFVYDLLPPWLFGIILFRLFFQAVGMLFVLLIRKQVEPKPTVFGKIAVATIMTLFATEALRFVAPSRFADGFQYVEAAADIVVALSVIDKGYYFFKRVWADSARKDGGR